MNIKPSFNAMAGVIGPVGVALAYAHGWVFACAFVLALANRIIPQESKDRLKLWMWIIPRRGGLNTEQETGEGHDRNIE